MDNRKLIQEHRQEGVCFACGGKNAAGVHMPFDVKGLREYLGVTDDWISKRVTYKEIPNSKLGKHTRFKKSAIDKWLESLSVKPITLLKNGERRQIPINGTLRETLEHLFQGSNAQPRRLDVPWVFYDSRHLTPYRDIKRSFYTASQKLPNRSGGGPWLKELSG